MGVTTGLRRFAFARPRYLMVAVPGRAGTRLAVERAARSRGWRPAASPADADVLVVCGGVTDALMPAVDQVWRGMTEPRARVTVPDPGVGTRVLDDAAAALLTSDPDGPSGGGQEDRCEGHGDHAQDMDEIAGAPMADREEDRDGMKLDVLHIQFGPVLPDWPAGLVLDMAVQGDVVMRAETRLLGPDLPSYRLADPALADLDRLARLLAVAGHDGAALRCRMIRDALATTRSRAEIRDLFAPLARRIRRSRTLRWMLRGVGPIDVATSVRLGLDVNVIGDAYDRLLRPIADVEAALAGEPDERAEVRPSAFADALPTVVEGEELAAVRLIVAGLDPGLEWAPAGSVVTHG